MSRPRASAIAGLGLVCLLLCAGPALADEVERLGAQPIDEPLEDKQASGTIHAPSNATEVQIELRWPSEDGKQAELDVSFCQAAPCSHGDAFRTFDGTESAIELTAAPEGGGLSWFADDPKDLPDDARLRGQAVFYAPADDPEPSAADRSSASVEASDQGPGWGLAAGLAGLAGVTTVAASAGSPKRWLPPGLLGLYHRISDDELLDHPLRSAIYDRVGEEPGIHFRQLLRDLDAARGNLQRHLDRMVDADLLSVHKGSGYRCYFVTGTVDPDLLDAAPVLRTDTARVVFQAVHREPGETLTTLADRTGLSTSTVGYHLDKLEDAGLVYREQDGNGLSIEATGLGRQAAEELAVA